MQTSYKTGASEGYTFHRYLGAGGFRGADFSSAENAVSPARLTECINLWRDYQSDLGGYLETFPGFRALCKMDAKINGLFAFTPSNRTGDGYLIIHAGTALYTCPITAASSTLTPTLLYNGMANHTSSAFAFGDILGILDGTTYRLLIYNNTTDSFALQKAEDLYIPLTYNEEAPFEQRNALCKYVKESRTISSRETYACGTLGLLYEIESESQKTCRVTGIVTPSPIVHIPSTTLIRGETYAVVSVGARAFQNDNIIETLILDEGIQGIERYAINTCRSLCGVSLPYSLAHIEKGAFANNPNLTDIHLGGGLASVEAYAFYECTSLTNVTYDKDELAWQNVSIGENNLPLIEANVTFDTGNNLFSGSYHFVLHEKCVSLSNVVLGTLPLPTAPYLLTSDTSRNPAKTYYQKIGERYEIMVFTDTTPFIPSSIYEKQPFWYVTKTSTEGNETLLDGIVVYATDGRLLTDLRLEVTATLSSTLFAPSPQPDFSALCQGSVGQAIHSCAHATVFDGRIFLSGSSALPGAVFYAQRDKDGHVHPAYFGVCNYICDGTDSTPVTAMCATATSLFVYKGNGAVDGTVFCHTPLDTDQPQMPRIYPARSGTCGAGCVGAACNFRDDPVYLSAKGLEATSKATVSLERNTRHVSYLIDKRLQREDLSHASLIEWQGYLLVLCPGGHIYMADSRLPFQHTSGEMQYEWMYLEGVGSYTNDLPVYRMASVFPENATKCQCGTGDILLSDNPDSLPFGDYATYEKLYPYAVISGNITLTLPDQTQKTMPGYHVVIPAPEGAKRYLVYPTDEKTGGNFAGATVGCSVADLLFLGTADGSIITANTDKRGIAQNGATIKADRIDRHNYTICQHRYISAAITAQDMADLPHMTKTTLKTGTVLETKTMPGSQLKLRVRSDREDWHDVGVYTAGELDFDRIDMAAFAFADRGCGLAVFREKNKRWAYTQYAIYTDEYQRPFGIRQLSYRAKVTGRIKRQ